MAADTAATSDDSANRIVVTGSRAPNYTVADSLVPIGVISRSALQNSGTGEPNKTLNQLVPWSTASSPTAIATTCRQRTIARNRLRSTATSRRSARRRRRPFRRPASGKHRRQLSGDLPVPALQQLRSNFSPFGFHGLFLHAKAAINF